MLFRGIINATLGRLLLPLRSVSSTSPGELWLDGLRAYLRANNGANPDLLRLLTDQDFYQNGGIVPTLGADGLIPAGLLPASAGGGSSDLVGSFVSWGGDPAAVPSTHLVCDGRNVLQALNPRLFAAFKHRYGKPSVYSGSLATFRLPNFIGRIGIGTPERSAMAAGRVHKINVIAPGSGFTVSTTLTTSLYPIGTAGVPTAVSVSIKTDADGGVERIDILAGGAVTGVSYAAEDAASNNIGASNCNLAITPTGGTGSGLQYEIAVAPTASSQQGWGVQMTERGAGYTSIPAVTINGPSLVGATAIAVLSGSQVREVIITNPGTGSPAGATVSFAGGGPTTPATAQVAFWTSPSMVGDLGGEQQHIQTLPEIASHQHTTGGTFGGGAWPTGVEWNNGGNPTQVATTFTGDGLPSPHLQPYVGVLVLVRAG
jgi:hypothetical protein